MSLAHLKQSLLSRVPDHPVAPRLRQAISDSLDAAERFAATKAEIERKGHLTPQGRREALKEALTRRYARDLRDAQGPIREAKTRLETMRSAIKAKPAGDRTDVVAALERQEIRATVAEMSAAKRATFVLGAKDPRIIEAILGAPAEVSGLPEDVFAKVEKAFVEQRFAAELREIEALEAILGEAQAAADIARDELRQTIDMDRKSFDAVMKPVEQKLNAPWLLKDGEQVLVVEPGEAIYKPATEDQIRDGVFYKDLAEYEQSRAA